MGINSLTLSRKEIDCLRKFISENKLKKLPPTNKYEILRIKEQNINLILYNTGKLVFNQNNETIKILNSILKRETGYDYFLGSDETGKGEWYGPLVVVVTALTPEEIIKLRILGVKDSKTMKTPKIIEMAKKIMEMGFPYQSLILIPHTYNKLYTNFKNEGKNLNDLMAWAHSRIIHELLEKIEFNQAKVVIDKFDHEKTEHRLGKFDENRIKIIQKTEGESEIPVAAASIIAKYLFEKEVDKLKKKYDINLRTSSPDKINPEILRDVAKIHFKNVKKHLNEKG